MIGRLRAFLHDYVAAVVDTTAWLSSTAFEEELAAAYPPPRDNQVSSSPASPDCSRT